MDQRQQKLSINRLKEKTFRFEILVEILNCLYPAWLNPILVKSCLNQKFMDLKSNKSAIPNQKFQIQVWYMKRLSHQSKMQTIGAPRIRYRASTLISWRKSIWRKLPAGRLRGRYTRGCLPSQPTKSRWN